MITTDEFKSCILGYGITDCVVRNKYYFHFLARNEKQSEDANGISEATVDKREIGFYLDEPLGSRLGYQGFVNFETTYVGATNVPLDQVVCIDSAGMVYSRGSGQKDFEEPIPKRMEGPRRGAVIRIRMIHGVLYVVGSDHTVCHRRGKNDWGSLCLNLPKPTRASHDDVDKSENMAFVDIDGFSHEDLYAIAGMGRIWHLDGKQWRQIPFPSNMRVTAICCVGDGYVYIGAQSGALFKGRGNEWRLIQRGDMTLPFQDIVWHAGRVWCTSDYGLWYLDGEKLVKPEVPSEIMVCAGNLSAADGVMLMAGVHGAAFHDGNEWQLIFNKHTMETQRS